MELNGFLNMTDIFLEANPLRIVVMSERLKTGGTEINTP
jgi:hypothetical protein